MIRLIFPPFPASRDCWAVSSVCVPQNKYVAINSASIAGESGKRIPIPEILWYINQKTGLIPAHSVGAFECRNLFNFTDLQSNLPKKPGGFILNHSLHRWSAAGRDAVKFNTLHTLALCRPRYKLDAAAMVQICAGVPSPDNKTNFLTAVQALGFPWWISQSLGSTSTCLSCLSAQMVHTEKEQFHRVETHP